MSANQKSVEELQATFDEKLAPLKVLILAIILDFVTSILLFRSSPTVIRVSVCVCISVFVCIQSDMLPYCTPHNKLISIIFLNLASWHI